MDQQSFTQLMQVVILLSVLVSHIWVAKVKAQKPQSEIGHLVVPLSAISIMIAGHFFGVAEGLSAVFGVAASTYAHSVIGK